MKKYGWTYGALLLGLLACESPKGYVIQGEISGLSDSTKIVLYLTDEDRYIDSTWTDGDRFQLKGFFEEVPQTLWLEVKIDGKDTHRWYQSMVLGNDHVTITGDTSDFPSRLQVSGSKYQDQFREFMAPRLACTARDSLLVLILKWMDDPQHQAETKEMIKQLSAIDRRLDSLEENYLFTHTDTYPSLRYLNTKMYAYPKDTVKMLLDRMSPELQANRHAKPIRTYIETESVSIGDPFLDFEAEDQQGNRVRLSDFVGKDGKYVLLDFTASGCGPCIQANKELRQMVKTYSDSLQIISFSTDSRKEVWLNSLKRDSVSWPSLWSAEDVETGCISVPYEIRSTPRFFVIDPQGKVIQKLRGYGKGSFDEQLGRLKNKE